MIRKRHAVARQSPWFYHAIRAGIVVTPTEPGNVPEDEMPTEINTHPVDLKNLIRDIPDFPKPGIVFKDITPLLLDPNGLSLAVEYLTQPYRGLELDAVAGTESRGFMFGIAVARNLAVGFIPIRKPGKLPSTTRSATYDLEYGTDTLEIHDDAIKPGQRILMVDDLLATGGTMAASCELVESLGGKIVGVSLLIELCFLNGREKLSKYPIHSIIKVNGD